jgi:hypothetical protein
MNKVKKTTAITATARMTVASNGSFEPPLAFTSWWFSRWFST